MISIKFWTSSGELMQVSGDLGETLMQTALRHGVPGIQGDCGGTLACATCHIHIKNGWSALLGEPLPEEDAMLDLVDNRCATSRLSCQIVVAEDIEGLEVQVVE